MAGLASQGGDPLDHVWEGVGLLSKPLASLSLALHPRPLSPTCTVVGNSPAPSPPLTTQAWIVFSFVWKPLSGFLRLTGESADSSGWCKKYPTLLSPYSLTSGPQTISKVASHSSLPPRHTSRVSAGQHTVGCSLLLGFCSHPGLGASLLSSPNSACEDEVLLSKACWRVINLVSAACRMASGAHLCGPVSRNGHQVLVVFV